jgi:hypothetical protein
VLARGNAKGKQQPPFHNKIASDGHHMSSLI